MLKAKDKRKDSSTLKTDRAYLGVLSKEVGLACEGSSASLAPARGPLLG